MNEISETPTTPTIEDYFRSVPKEVTELPIFQDPRGSWFALGHIDPIEMTLAIHAVDSYMQDEESAIEANPEDMQYFYGKVSEVRESGDVEFMVCKPSEEGSFPITIWNFQKPA